MPSKLNQEEDGRVPRPLLQRMDQFREFPLGALEGVVRLREYLETVEERAVRRARELGATWETIADALGVTRQAVYQKHHRNSKSRR